MCLECNDVLLRPSDPKHVNKLPCQLSECSLSCVFQIFGKYTVASNYQKRTRAYGTMGKRKFQDFIPDECHRRYSCVHCRAHLASHDELISKVRIAWQLVEARPMYPYALGLKFQLINGQCISLVCCAYFIQSFQGSQGKAYLFNKV